MSDSISIKELLEGVEVEFKPLGELGELVRGNGLPKKDFTKAGVPAIHYGQIYTYYGSSTTETKSFVSPEAAKKLKKVNSGDVVITNTSENLEDVGKALSYLGETQAVTGGHATIFKPNKDILGKYFTYYTQTSMFFNQKRKYAKGAKVIDVSATDMAKIQIPIPALKVQREIVRILDNFTELTTELTAELSARKKQYSYYRDRLLTFDERDVEFKALREVVKIKNGKDWKKLGDGSIPVYGSGGIMGFVDTASYDKVSVLIPRKGTITNIFYTEESFWNVDTIFYTEINENIIVPKYFYYFMSNYNLIALSTDSTRPSLTQTILNKIQVPIPPLAEQKRIVTILDKFDTLTNSISEGLPKEIELREKQYAYYRDKLLSFSKVEKVD